MSPTITENGQRKYLTKEERIRFLQEARQARFEIYTFCRLLLDTGCRISEALNLRKKQVDLVQKCIYIESLKKRRKGVFRRIPVSNTLLVTLMRLYELRGQGSLKSNDPFWNWTRMTAYRHVCRVMKEANIKGAQASPKGLRHGFAVAALQAGAPMNLVQRWMGHSHWNTTAIYADMVDDEERQFAELLWFGAKKGDNNEQPPHSIAA